MRLSILSPKRQRNFPLRYEPLNQTLGALVSFISGNPAPNRDHKLPDFRPPRDHWGPRLNKALEGEIEKPKPDIKSLSPSPAPRGIGGKALKAGKAFVAAMLEIFPPPPNSGIRPVYISSMSIGGRRPEPE